MSITFTDQAKREGFFATIGIRLFAWFVWLAEIAATADGIDLRSAVRRMQSNDNQHQV